MDIKANDNHGQKLINGIANAILLHQKLYDLFSEFVINNGYVGFHERNYYTNDIDNKKDIYLNLEIANNISIFWESLCTSSKYSKKYNLELNDIIAIVDTSYKESNFVIYEFVVYKKINDRNYYLKKQGKKTVYLENMNYHF